MRLATYTDYTLRVLIYLAVNNDTTATIDGMARSYDISRHHLGKVVHHLRLKGYVETVRGRGGGVGLAVAPADINVGAVVRACEQDSTLVECFSANNNCCITSACVLRTAFADAQEAFYSTLDGYTLRDLTRPRQVLARLLDIAG